MTAQSARIAFLALILPVAALVSSQDTWAASGNVQICNPSASCTIGEFVYDDSYVPITSATCTITSRFPNGSLFLNAVTMPVSSQGDGWYAHTFTAPTTVGLYRTEVKCIVGSNPMALDKSFEVQNAPSSLTSSDVSSAVWGYSNRSLTTFGSLISDIWSYSTNTLNNIINNNTTNNSTTNFTTTQSSISSRISNIEKLTTESRLLLEQLVKKPIIKNLLEEAPNLRSKIDETNNKLGQLFITTQYLKAKTALMNNKWKNLGEEELIGKLTDLSNSIGALDDPTHWLKKSWDFPQTNNLEKQTKIIKKTLASIQDDARVKNKSKNTKEEFKRFVTEIETLESILGKVSDGPYQKTLYGKVKQISELAYTLDAHSKTINKYLMTFGASAKDQNLEVQTSQLSTEIAKINRLPKLSPVLAQTQGKNPQSQLKNKLLTLQAVIDSNKQLLARKPGQAFSNTYLMEGSIVFKTLITNPSTLISQTVPLKYYLPQEVKKEYIINIDKNLTVTYDSEKDQYYVTGELTLAAGETKTVSIVVDDKVFTIPQEQIQTYRKQVEDLSKVLTVNTSFFAQAVSLKSDIDVALDKIKSLQKQASTPEAKIRAHREATIELDGVKVKLEKLKELVTSASSVGTLFGFVGGAQALSVWGLIIILSAGFIFLTLYLRSIKKSEMMIAEPIIKPEKKTEQEKPIHMDQKRHVRHYKMIAVVAIGILGVFSMAGVALISRTSIQKPAVKPQQLATAPKEQKPSVLGADSEKVENLKGEEVTLQVPDETLVSLHSKPQLETAVLTNLKTTQTVLQVNSQDGWARIVVTKDGKKIAGWVDKDFIENRNTSGIDEKKEPKKTISRTLNLVTIADTPTGFLRVRSKPWGEELDRVEPGKKFPVIDAQNGWLQIVLDNGSLGWISDQYILSSKIPKSGLD